MYFSLHLLAKFIILLLIRSTLFITVIVNLEFIWSWFFWNYFQYKFDIIKIIFSIIRVWIKFKLLSWSIIWFLKFIAIKIFFFIIAITWLFFIIIMLSTLLIIGMYIFIFKLFSLFAVWILLLFVNICILVGLTYSNNIVVIIFIVLLWLFRCLNIRLCIIVLLLFSWLWWSNYFYISVIWWCFLQSNFNIIIIGVFIRIIIPIQVISYIVFVKYNFNSG